MQVNSNQTLSLIGQLSQQHNSYSRQNLLRRQMEPESSNTHCIQMEGFAEGSCYNRKEDSPVSEMQSLWEHPGRKQCC